ncbi:MAG: 4Fe-4S dicluster domain-containing protein [Candidatus Hadarchaeum sp.]|uniref:4Fe-4S dicluster domain-containing protein n=1 Tax=Candidatus Hadarchaeum sp. TaxID=2883567 RepID=UPI003D113548
MPYMETTKDTSLVKFMFVDVDPNRCIGCGICELACSFEKTGNKAFNPLKSRIRVLRIPPAFNLAISCRLCEDPPCVRACPRGALRQSENGPIVVNKDKCNGCGWCIKACDFGSITIDPDEKIAIVCDLCERRKGIGVFPGRKIANQACIEWCPEEAIELVSRERLAQKARELTLIKLLSSSRKPE